MTVFVKAVKNWNIAFKSTKGMVGKDMHDRGARGVGYAAMQVGYRTGQLQRSIKYKVSRDLQGVSVMVGSSHRRAYLHHYGSKPHPILARNVRYLRFRQNGRIRFAKRVYHPGTRPNKYLTDNLRRMVS